MKPPAFQFYPDNFIEGTVDMSTEDVGAYIRLLCFQWNRGSIPVDDRLKLERICGCSVSQDVLAKFPNGKNERMEKERDKQRDFRELQRQKGLASSEARRNRGSTAVQPVLQPKVNSPSPSPISTKTNQRSKTNAEREEVISFCKEIGLTEADGDATFDKWEGNGWTNNGRKIADWRATIRNWKKCGFMPSQKGANGKPATLVRPTGYENWKSPPKPGDPVNPEWGTQAYIRKHGQTI